MNLSPDLKSVLISVSPKSGAKSGRPVVEKLKRMLGKAGFEVQISTDIDEVQRESDRLQHEGKLRTVVAAGGDGTAGLVANHTPAGVPITVLPLGTENLLAKYLGITANAQSVSEIIQHGATRLVDAGKVGDRIFLLMVCCGLDADVVRRLHEDRSGHISHFSYAKPILDSIRNYEYPELQLYCDDQPSFAARWGFIFNLPCYARGLKIAPSADGTDGLLDVCAFKHGSLWSGLKYLSGIILGQHETWEDCVTRQSKTIRIESEGQVPYSVDGDPGGHLPIEIEVIPNRLTLVVPETV